MLTSFTLWLEAPLTERLAEGLLREALIVAQGEVILLLHPSTPSIDIVLGQEGPELVNVDK